MPPPAADKPLIGPGAADVVTPRPLDEDDDDDELIDDDEDGEENLPINPPLHHNPALAVDEEDLPTSSSSSAAEEEELDNDNEATQLILPPSSATNNSNPNILALPMPSFNNGSGTLLSSSPAMLPADPSQTPSPKRLRIDDVKPTPTPPPSDDSRRLFQRLWTDDDEIELLQGFLEFTGQRSSSNHHQDTTVFYDQIKTKLQVDFNKNQLVEKLRRLKKKYRNALNRINTSKDFAFKSPHEQATFDISSQIWNSAASLRAQIPTASVDDTSSEDPNNTLLHNNNNGAGGARLTTRKRARAPRSTLPDLGGGGLSPAAAAMAAAAAAGGGATTTTSVMDQQYQQQQQQLPSVVVAGYSPLHHPPHTLLAPPNPVSAAVPMSLIEDTVRSCLSPLFKELLQCAVTTSGGPGPHGFAGGGMPLNPLPQFMGWSLGSGGPPAAVGGGLMNHSESMDERLRRQQILELEVYSKRLELVQEQIKVALEDLKSKGG